MKALLTLRFKVSRAIRVRVCPGRGFTNINTGWTLSLNLCFCCQLSSPLRQNADRSKVAAARAYLSGLVSVLAVCWCRNFPVPS